MGGDKGEVVAKGIEKGGQYTGLLRSKAICQPDGGQAGQKRKRFPREPVFHFHSTTPWTYFMTWVRNGAEEENEYEIS